MTAHIHMEPVDKPTAQRGPDSPIAWGTIADELRDHPGQWFKVATFGRRTNQGHRIRRGEVPEFRDGKWDAITELVRVDSVDTWVLYVVFEPVEERPVDARRGRKKT